MESCTHCNEVKSTDDLELTFADITGSLANARDLLIDADMAGADRGRFIAGARALVEKCIRMARDGEAFVLSNGSTGEEA